MRVDSSGPVQGTPLSFEDPAPCRLALLSEEHDAVPVPFPAQDTALLEAWVLPAARREDAAWREALQHWVGSAPQARGACALAVRSGEIHVSWTPGRAVVFAPPALAEGAWEVLLDFARLEGELRRIETEIHAAWPGFQQDTPLAYDVHRRDLSRDTQIAHRARTVLDVRMRHARLEPLLCESPARFTQPYAQLAEALRENALCEERLQYADGQLEVQESLYEMASQRIGEFRNTYSTFITEMIIIGLLAAEVLLMLWEALRG
jgi:hypothetical protein